MCLLQLHNVCACSFTRHCIDCDHCVLCVNTLVLASYRLGCLSHNVSTAVLLAHQLVRAYTEKRDNHMCGIGIIIFTACMLHLLTTQKPHVSHKPLYVRKTHQQHQRYQDTITNCFWSFKNEFNPCSWAGNTCIGNLNLVVWSRADEIKDWRI